MPAPKISATTAAAEYRDTLKTKRLTSGWGVLSSQAMKASMRMAPRLDNPTMRLEFHPARWPLATA